MSITSKWCHHIEKWQNSGLTQAEYCLQQQINVRTFTVKLSEYRKLSAIDSVALVPVQLESTQSPASLPAPMTVGIVAMGYIMELLALNLGSKIFKKA
jgi:hypothetical protein